ncbi:MAG: DNRLRE domain-containing protein, partial [Chloroflexi bacterium]|nr:DNRLRE domain-containing protein [Chloroflexota bacterium]
AFTAAPAGAQSPLWPVLHGPLVFWGTTSQAQPADPGVGRADTVHALWSIRNQATGHALWRGTPGRTDSSDAACLSVQLTFSPASVTANVGDIFSLEVMVEAGSQPLNNVELYIEFDPLVLQVVDRGANPVLAIEPDCSTLSSVLWNEVDNATGHIRYDAGRLSDTPPTGTFRVATIRLQKTSAATSTAVHYVESSEVFYAGASVLGGLGSTMVVAPAPTASPTATETPTQSPMPTQTDTCTPTPTKTSTHTVTPSPLPTATATPTFPAAETTLTLQQGTDGSSGCQDTYIYAYDPDNSDDYWSLPQIKVGDRQRHAALIRFDLSTVPTDATVMDAQLQLFAESRSGGDLPIGAFLLVRTTTIQQATWNQAESGNRWGIPGCNDPALDRRPAPESSFTATGAGRWYSFGLTAAVQDWVAGSLPNNGLLLRSLTSTSTYYFNFVSANGGTVSLRPRLILTYRSDSPPATPAATASPSGTPTDAQTPSPSPTLTQTTTPTESPTASPTATTSWTPTPTPTTLGTGTTLALQQGTDGYSGCQDTYIYAYDPDNSDDYWPLPQIKVGDKQRYAALIRFDLSAIPDNVTVSNAQLHLFAESRAGGEFSIAAFHIIRTTTIQQVTWNEAQSGNRWAIPGCNDSASDRRETPESSLTTAGAGRSYSFDLTSLVQGWLNGLLPNNGILLRSLAPASTSSFNFASANSSTISKRPRLIVTYRPAIPGPTSTPTATEFTDASPTATSAPAATSTATATELASPSPTQTPSPLAAATPTISTAKKTLTLQQGSDGYYGCQDTSIYAYDPDNSDDYWPQAQLKVGYKQRYAALIRFEVSDIPADAAVLTAVLRLRAEGWSGSNLTLDAYAIHRTTTIHQATWNHSQAGNLWVSPGCNHIPDDRAGIPESTVTTNGVHRWYEWDLTSAVQAWVNGSLPNNGILLRGDSPSS